MFVGFLLLLVAVPNVYTFKRRDINIINTKNEYFTTFIEVGFPLKDVIAPSTELALTECQKLFKWDRWNCPRSDFLSKQNSQVFDRETAFVRALTIAALIYTITRKCSEERLPGCECNDKDPFQICSDNPEYAENVLDKIFNDMEQSSSDAQGYAGVQNSRAGRIAVRNSIKTHCRCDAFQKSCVKQTCWTKLKNFTEIATHLRRMYDNALFLKVHNSGISNWDSIPRNSLVFVQESPNYCTPGSVSGWKGMEGRECSRSKDKERSLQERRSCRHLCKECGFRVRTEVVLTQEKCNCTFVWCCRVECEVCEQIGKKHYCE